MPRRPPAAHALLRKHLILGASDLAACGACEKLLRILLCARTRAPRLHLSEHDVRTVSPAITCDWYMLRFGAPLGVVTVNLVWLSSQPPPAPPAGLHTLSDGGGLNNETARADYAARIGDLAHEQFLASHISSCMQRLHRLVHMVTLIQADCPRMLICVTPPNLCFAKRAQISTLHTCTKAALRGITVQWKLNDWLSIECWDGKAWKPLSAE